MRFLPCIPLTHIYMSRISHFCGRIFKHTILDIVYDGKGTQNQTHSHLLGIMSQLNEFHTIPSQKSSPHTIHKVYSQESTSSLPKGIGNNMIFLFQKFDTIDRTAKGRTWLASQDNPDYM